MVDGKARVLGRETLTTAVIFVALAGLGATLSSFLSFASAIPIFLCALTLLAWRMSRWVSVLACLIATLTLDFFFTQPRYDFRVGSGQDVAALLSFLITVLFISVLSGRLSKQAPGTAAVALGLAKVFPITEAIHLRFESTFTNVLNHTNFAPPATQIDNTSTFGQLTTATTASAAVRLRRPRVQSRGPKTRGGPTNP